MPSGSRKHVRTVTVVETPQKYEKQVERLRGDIDQKRRELRNLTEFSSVRTAIDTAKLELADVEIQRTTVQAQAKAIKEDVDGQQRDLRTRRYELKKAGEAHEQAVRNHRERVDADHSQLAVREREAKAQENRALQACEAAAEKETSARSTEERARGILEEANQQFERVCEKYERLDRRRVVIGLHRMWLERDKVSRLTALALARHVLRLARKKLQRVAKAEDEQAKRQRVIEDVKRQVERTLKEAREREIKEEARLDALDAREREVKRKSREQNDVDREQAKREARLLGWQEQLKSKDRRVAMAAETVGKKVVRDAEGSS